MIFDSLDNLRYYACLDPGFAAAAEFLENNRLEDLTDTKYDAGSGVYAMVSTYDTRQLKDCFIECHRRYTDIQIVISGSERIGFCNIHECSEKTPYQEEQDLQKLDGKPDFLELKPGYFAVFFPNDGHMPQTAVDEVPGTVRKLVLKLPVW
ncbi:MAG: YhcH/YjgK/YiaL family protein [Bacteroidota bacterium]